MARIETISEAEILGRVVGRDVKNWSEGTARDLLKLKFDSKTRTEIRRLLRKNNKGSILPGEQIALDRFVRVGLLIDLLQARAKATLAHKSPGN